MNKEIEFVDGKVRFGVLLKTVFIGYIIFFVLKMVFYLVYISDGGYVTFLSFVYIINISYVVIMLLFLIYKRRALLLTLYCIQVFVLILALIFSGFSGLYAIFDILIVYLVTKKYFVYLR